MAKDKKGKPKVTGTKPRNLTVGIDLDDQTLLEDYCKRLAAADPTRKNSMRFIAGQAIREYIARHPIPETEES